MACPNSDETAIPIISPQEEDILTMLAGRDHYSTRVRNVLSRLVKRGLLAKRQVFEEAKELGGKRGRYTHYTVTDLGFRALEEAVTRNREEGRPPGRRPLQPNIPGANSAMTSLPPVCT